METLRAYQQSLRNGETSCRDTVQKFLTHIQENRHLNAYLEVFADEALARAAALDDKLARGEKTGKLFGAVISIKDNICYRGHRVSAASKILEGFTSVYSATVVERMLAEDAIIIGRTNCDEFAMGSSNENSAYGPVLNACDNSRVPGGSSGGSAVSVQAGLCHASLGSDTGGSIRQPASFCGVVGLKPSYGRVSRYGLIAYASSFDQIGPFTQHVEDAALLLEVIAGKDRMDATTSLRPVMPYTEKLQFNRRARIAVFPETLRSEGLQEEVRQATLQIIEQLELAGHIVEEVDFAWLDYLIPAYYILTTAEASSNLARYDGVHYGYRSPDATDMETIYKKSRTEGFGKEVKNRIMLGTFVLSAGYYDAYYSRAQKVRRLLSDNISAIFQKHDFILMPTSPCTAFRFGEKTNNPVEMYLADIYTVLANLVGIPAISLPLARSAEGLPIGIQLMADSFQEQKLLAFSSYLMQRRQVVQ
ncbi:MAG: Asp-tRNA(Asn)/Glu-tRNA(Gln) amidotransferase subunit GatA [Chitinophagales bacterium]|nr:Asp-tRNA(Asn)/Glu-tRNA(Gln) amidotransferase subunit GatA [Chitinophagales bacterium]MDW8418927.1 Asp-tRNA(Asn)/Glu-tRNA(Gln) amidotransferase subunit GatA [Chitinophagales bacterium]